MTLGWQWRALFERFDVVINAQGPPATAQANRAYTLEFFREVARVFEPGGVFAFRAAGGHTYVQEENRRLLGCLHRTAAEVFPAVIAFPGEPVQFLASNRAGGLTYRLDVLQARLDARGIAAPYADATVWQEQLVGGRLEELQAILTEEPAPAVNRDLAPRCYYFEAQRWSALQRTRLPGARPAWLDLGRLLRWLDQRPAAAPLAILGLLAAVSLAVPLVRRRGRDAALSFAVASSGLIEMAVEFVVLLGFQVAYGYVYHYLGVLVAAFMVGLTAGGWISSRWVTWGRATWRRLVWVQGGLCGYPLALLGFLVVATRTGLGESPLVAALLFSGVATAAGLVGGLQFPLAAAQHSAGETSAGTLYGQDLFGACLGALAVSSVLVPTFGLPTLCLMLSALAGIGWVALLLATTISGVARGESRPSQRT